VKAELIADEEESGKGYRTRYSTGRPTGLCPEEAAPTPIVRPTPVMGAINLETSFE
jgi:hypothetical protein